MSNHLHAEILVEAGTLGADALRSALRISALMGYSAGGQAHPTIQCVTGDGQGTVLFDGVEGALAWLSLNDGLLSLNHSAEESEVFLSVHRVVGMLPLEMEYFPDTPAYDVVTLTTPLRDVVGVEGRSRWASLQRLIISVAADLRSLFAIVTDEDSLEITAPYRCIHDHVSRGSLPPVLGLLTIVPNDSPLINDLRTAAALLGRDCMLTDRSTILQLGDEPLAAPAPQIVDATHRWQAYTGDACGGKT